LIPHSIVQRKRVCRMANIPPVSILPNFKPTGAKARSARAPPNP
jgi:hypothetical protein